MQRRSFFKTVWTGVLAIVAARRAPAQQINVEAMRELAGVILPASLGRERIEKTADNFIQWLRDYKPGAQIASGYGHPRTQVTGPNPAANYAEQLAALGSPITRESVEKALDAAKVDRIPQRPNGRYVAADLLAFFYGSADGEDFLYNAAIRRDDCRGLANSGRRPARLA